MRQVIVHNLSSPQVQPIRARYCVSFFCRMRGLTFRRYLSPEEGLLLVQGRDSRLEAAIHMLGVFMDLAVVWINSIGVVVDVRLAHRWRLIYVPQSPASYVLELSPTRLQEFKIGHEIYLEETFEGTH